jgi:hypothetical protein
MEKMVNTRSALAALLLALAAVACRADGAEMPPQVVLAEDSVALGGEAAAEPEPVEPTGPVTDLPPNELGEIMVLEYHRIGDNEGEWVRSRDNFRRDLQTLYEKGYRPVLMRDVVRRATSTSRPGPRPSSSPSTTPRSASSTCATTAASIPTP